MTPSKNSSDYKALLTDASYNAEAKKAFHRVAAKYLRRLATELNLPKGTYDVDHNQGGIAVSGEVTLHGEHLHLWVEQFFGGPKDAIVCFRGCHGKKDYTGMTNNFTDALTLMDTPKMAERCRWVINQAVAAEDAQLEREAEQEIEEEARANLG